MAGALVAGLTLGGPAVASAARRPSQAVAAKYSVNALVNATSPIATLSNLTGLTVEQIMTLRAQGESLSDIAIENGVDPAIVVDRTIAARQRYLDSLVASHRITTSQKRTVLAMARIAMQAMLDMVPGSGRLPSVGTTMTPSMPATGGLGAGLQCPVTPADPASGTVGPRPGYDSDVTTSQPCPRYVASSDPAPAPAEPDTTTGVQLSGSASVAVGVAPAAGTFSGTMDSSLMWSGGGTSGSRCVR